MKGFELSRSGSVIHSALENGVTSVLISNKEGYCSIYIGGTDAAGVSYTWASAKLESGDVIEVRYKDIETSQVSNIMDDDFRNQVLLDTYQCLKKELQDEGYDI